MAEETLGGTSPGRWAMAGLTAVVFLLLFARAMTRPLDLDEHQFIAPAALLRQGVRPYVDYPYFHMPTLVYLYAEVLRWAPAPLLATRVVSVLCGTATILLLFLTTWRLLGATAARRTCWTVAGGMAAIYLSSRLFTYTNGWAWNHDSAVLCTLLAFLCHRRGLARDRLGWFAAAGFLLACAVGIRLSFALAFIPFAVSLLRGQPGMAPGRRILALTAAAVAATVAFWPVWLNWSRAPDRFFFGNVTYASLNTMYSVTVRSPNMGMPLKVRHFFQTFLADPANAAILGLFAFAAWRAYRNRLWRSAHGDALLLLGGLLAALLVGAWGPTPAQYQYYYMLLPFMTLAVATVIAADGGDALVRRRWVRAVGVCATVAALTGLPRWYWPVIHVLSPEKWTPVIVHRDANWLREHVSADARVLTIDPAVPLEAGVHVYPEYAVGRFILLVSEFMTPEERRHYHMAWGEELDRVLAERPPDAVLCDRRVSMVIEPFVRYAREHGFRPLESPDGEFLLWVRPSVIIGEK